MEDNFFEVLSKKPLYTLVYFINECFEEGFTLNPDALPTLPAWVDYEVETIIYQIEDKAKRLMKADQLVIDDLIFDKIEALKTLFIQPELFYENLTFFIYITEVVLNESPDFSSISLPNSLEMAQAIQEVERTLTENGFPLQIFNEDMSRSIAEILKEEGFSEPTKYFNFIEDGILQPGQEETDMVNKETAITSYLNYLDNSRV